MCCAPVLYNTCAVHPQQLRRVGVYADVFDVFCRLRGIKLGNFEFSGSQLQLGQLRGNAFRILMRDVDTHDEQQVSVVRCLAH
jgi:tRNA(Glu) U13 pseudouridine synthase TruD